MIPHLVLCDEIFRNGLPHNHGLKDRVTACRKRLRLYRALHKAAPVRNQSDEIFQEPDSAVSDSRRYTEEYLAIKLVEEQEVGIT